MSQTPPPPYGQDPNQPQQPYGQQPYGQQPQVPYGAPQAYAPVLPAHPQATTVLILGIVGLAACGLAAPFAWVMGNRVVAEIDASGGRIGGRSAANAGRICGIVGSILIVVSIAVVILAFVIIAVSASTGV